MRTWVEETGITARRERSWWEASRSASWSTIDESRSANSNGMNARLKRTGPIRRSGPRARSRRFDGGVGSFVGVVVFVVALVGHVVDVVGLVVDSSAGHAGQLLLHEAANLELHGAFFGNLDGF